jgi:hypothetical protein
MVLAMIGELFKIFVKSAVAVGGVHAGNGVIKKLKEKQQEKKRKRLEEEMKEHEEQEESF